MNTLSFLNTPLLWGLTLAVIPIIIHLLFRRRFRRVDWAPMHYLKLSVQRNRRRIRLEQWLLLALRTLLILLLFNLVARPVLHAAGLGGWLFASSGTSQVLVIDDSLSMGHLEQGRSALDRATELAGQVLTTLGPKDRFTLVLASQPREPVFRDIEVTDPQVAAKMLAGVRPSGALASYKTVMQSVDDLITTSTYPISELTFITDLRRAGWEEALRAIGEKWAARRLRMRIFDVGSDRTQNVALDDLLQVDRLALAGNTTGFEAVVKNATDYQVESLDATWSIDGQPSAVRLPPLAAGQTARIPLPVTFQEPGTHHVALELPSDELPGDNRRGRVCRVAEHVNILVVDGEPSGEPLGGEADFLALALALGVGEAEAFRVQVVTDSEWESLGNLQPDLVVLAGVAGMTREQAQRLHRQVESGTGLMVFVGEQVDPAAYNELLYRDKSGLLPAALESAADEDVAGLVLEEGSPGALTSLSQLNPAVLERIRLHRYFQVQLADPIDPSVRVLARWNNAEGSPAVLEKTVGLGRILLWTTTADKGWSDWPTDPSYVLAVREAVGAIARTDAGPLDVTSGDVLRVPLAEGQQVRSPTIEVPNREKPQPLKIEGGQSKTQANTQAGSRAEAAATPPSIEGPRSLTYTDTRQVGLYKLDWQTPPRGTKSELVAVNPDRRESELARISADEVRASLFPLVPEVISARAGADNPIAIRGREIWRPLAMGMLCLLVVESCFATWTGRQH